MSEINVNSVLMQIRNLAAQAGGAGAAGIGGIGGVNAGQPADAAGRAPANFVDALKGAVEATNRQQLSAAQAAKDFELGRTDLTSAMLQVQTSQLSFRAMAEVRNRVVRAYQDILNMPV